MLNTRFLTSTPAMFIPPALITFLEYCSVFTVVILKTNIYQPCHQKKHLKINHSGRKTKVLLKCQGKSPLFEEVARGLR